MKRRWVYLIIVAAVLEVISFGIWGVNKYYKTVGLFTVGDVAISSEYVEFDPQITMLSDIHKYNDVLYVDDISDPTVSYIFRLQDGEVERVSKDSYYRNFMDEELQDSPYAVTELWDRVYGLHKDAETDAGRVFYIRGGTYECIEENGKYLISNSDQSMQLSTEKLGECRSLVPNVEVSTLCISEEKGPKKYLRLLSTETGEELWRCEDGRDPWLGENMLCFRTFEGLAVYDLVNKERRDIALSDFVSFRMFDDGYIYCVKSNNDVTRIDTKTMQEQAVLTSNLDKPLIKLYLTLHPVP